MSDGEDQHPSRDAMLFMGNAIASHTNEMRTMCLTQICICLVILVLIAIANFGGLYLDFLAYQREERRHDEIMMLNARGNVSQNQNVNVQRPRSIEDMVAEELAKQRVSGNGL